MALLDKHNKIIYWDGVNWQWLPFLSLNQKGYVLVNLKEHIDTVGYTLRSHEEFLSSLEGAGYSLKLYPSSLKEVSKGVFLYKGIIHQVPRGSIAYLISTIKGCSDVTVSQLVKQGLTLEEVLNYTIEAKHTGGIELLGVPYKSKKKLLEAFDCGRCKVEVVFENKGVYPDELLVKYLKNKGSSRFSPLKDSNGVYYLNIADAARDLGTSYSSIKRSISGNGIITLSQVPTKSNPIEVCGVVYPSVPDLARALGYNTRTCQERLNSLASAGLSKDYLVLWKEVSRLSPAQDHLGNWYPNRTDMYKSYGVTYTAYFNRLKRGWSLEEALTGNRGKED